MAVRSVRKVKFKFKWTKELIFLIVGILALIAVTVVLSLPSKLDKLRKTWSEASLSKETVITEIKYEDLVKEIKKESGFIFVFYGTPADSNSVTNIAKIDNLAQTFEVDKVYWLNSEEVFSADDEKKNSTDFIQMVDGWESALSVEDMTVSSSFFMYQDGEIKMDSTTKENATFDQILNSAFGYYASCNKENK